MSRLATSVLVFSAVVLIASTSWAIFEVLGPSQDEWRLKYDVEVSAADGDTLTVAFTLEDGGRLKPIYSITVVAFSQPDQYGARTYKIKAPLKLRPTKDGKRVGQVQIRKEFADRALIRILTQTVDGRRVRTANAALYDIPLKKFLE